MRCLTLQCFLILTSNVPVPYFSVPCFLTIVSSMQIAKPNRLIAELVINYIVQMRAAKKRKVDSEGRVFIERSGQRNTFLPKRDQLQYALFAKKTSLF